MKKRLVLIGILAVALILPFAINVEKAGADNILFPWISKDTTVSTIISVVNTAQGDGVQAELLHYQYWYKESTDNEQDEVCDNISFKAPTSKDDIVTFDASGIINSGEALYNDPGAGVWKAGPTYGGTDFSLSAAAPRRAFLIVDNDTPSFVTQGSNEDGTLYGEAMNLEISGGAAWGYIAYNASGGGSGTAQNGAVSFIDGLDVLGEVIGNAEETQTTLLPPDTIHTRFFLTPVDVLDAGDHAAVNQRVGDANAKVQLCITPNQAGACTEGGIFENDENKIDFEREKNIVCTMGENLYNADDGTGLMTEAAFTTFSDHDVHGWAYVVTHLGTVDADSDGTADNPTGDMIIGKLEWTISGVTIDGTTVGAALNNFVWLRDSETVTGAFGINYIHNATD